MIGKIKSLNFKSLFILNTFALLITSYLFDNFIFIGIFLLFFFVSWLTTKYGLKVIKDLNFFQNIRKLGPSAHFIKQNTPTAGGIFFMIPS